MHRKCLGIKQIIVVPCLIYLFFNFSFDFTALLVVPPMINNGGEKSFRLIFFFSSENVFFFSLTRMSKNNKKEKQYSRLSSKQDMNYATKNSIKTGQNGGRQ